MAATLSGPNFNGTIFAWSKYHSLIISYGCAMDDEDFACKPESMPGSMKNLANQYGVQRHFWWKYQFFFAVSLSGWCDCIDIFYSSICFSKKNFKSAIKHLWSARFSKKCCCCPREFVHHFFSKPGAIMADVGKLLWAQTSCIVFVVVCLYLGLLENILFCEFH